MDSLEFIKKLYNGKNCYSDPMTEQEIKLLYIQSSTEKIIDDMLKKKKVVFLTGNPGDGKTYIVRTLSETIKSNNIYVEADMNSVLDMNITAEKIIECYYSGRGCLIAINEYPLLKLMKQIKKLSNEVYSEMSLVKKNSVIYEVSTQAINRIGIVDLNDRNLLDKDRGLIDEVISKLVSLLVDKRGINKQLDYNLDSFNNLFVRNQLLNIFKLVSISGEHYAMRDILGAFSYSITAYDNSIADEFVQCLYYDALFTGENQLLVQLRRFDPIFLSKPELDEQLWNGEFTDGWIMGTPDIWPNEIDEVDKAIKQFKSIKRRFYFENTLAIELENLQPNEYSQCDEIFRNIEAKKKTIKKDLVRSLNKLFLPSDDEKNMLRVWTTHNYDLSHEASAAVSSRFVDVNDLDILVPRPADWLVGMEYTPAHIVLKHKELNGQRLIMDFDFIRVLMNVKDGYPIGLLSSQYEQAAGAFLKALDDNNLCEEYEDGQIIIANRSKSYKRSIYIKNSKYSFDEEVDN